MAQREVCLVGVVRPLHRHGALGLETRRELVRVHARLQLAIAALERGGIDRVAGRKSEQLEVVFTEFHGNWGRLPAPIVQMLKDSPQPQRSFSFGLLNLKPSFRPSFT